MDTLASLLAAVPDDPRTALIVADFLEEQSDPRAELVRLVYTLTRKARIPKRTAMEDRLRELLYTQKLLPPVPLREIRVGNETVLMAWIPPGSFRMGSPVRERGREHEEFAHNVTLTRGFWMGVYPVTQTQWLALRTKNPSDFPGENRPVDNISWKMANAYCATAAKATRLPIRLPTEAEWEYACRAGTTSPYCYGNELPHEQALFELSYEVEPDEEDEGSAEVGSYPPNAFGLYDMHGNVFEWVRDTWQEDYYRDSPAVDPTGPVDDTSIGHILRGGSWAYDAASARSAFRITASRDYAYYDQGFRIVCDHFDPSAIRKRK